MSLTVILAPMFSGKTTYLLSQASISYDIGFTPIFITHSLENRSNDVFVHSSIFTPNLQDKIPVIKTDSLCKIISELLEYSHIYIDEFQFFSEEKDKIEIVNLCKYYNKHVYIAGLKSDYNNKKFGMILDLIPEADEVVFLKSNCISCAKEGNRVGASFTKRTNLDKDIVSVGASDKYIPVCRKHYYD